MVVGLFSILILCNGEMASDLYRYWERRSIFDRRVERLSSFRVGGPSTSRIPINSRTLHAKVVQALLLSARDF